MPGAPRRSDGPRRPRGSAAAARAAAEAAATTAGADSAPDTTARRPRTRPVTLSIIVPTRNEAANITPLWRQLTATLSGVDFEVCFVDDSDDMTPALLAKLEDANPGRVRCTFRTGAAREGGLATAVVAGLRVATGRYVCVMDADLQHPVDTIPRMLNRAEQGDDLVVASRYLRGGSRQGLSSLGRRIVSRMSALVTQALFSEARRTTDPLTGFFVCRRELIDGIEFRPVGFKILLELLVCIPGMRVADVPLAFAPRAAGESKATMAQGWMFLRHLASLFFRVEGSARFWKFGLVGLSGLALYVALIAVATHTLHLGAAASFAVAFVPSVIWNGVINSLWTFADLRRRRIGREWRGYTLRALAGGAVNFALFMVLVTEHALSIVPAALLAGLAAMALNGVTNFRATHHAPRVWGTISADSAMTTAMSRLARRVGADRAYLLPPQRTTIPATVPAAIFERTVTLRRAAVWTEAASHRPQRRANIDITSTLLLPLVNGGTVVGVVVFEKRSPRGFPGTALATATAAVESLVPLLLNAAGIPEARRFRALAARAGTHGTAPSAVRNPVDGEP